MFTCDDGLSSRLDTNDLDLFPNLDNTLLNAACHHSASALDAENIFYREGEGAVQGPGGVWNVVINSLHQLQDGFPVSTWLTLKQVQMPCKKFFDFVCLDWVGYAGALISRCLGCKHHAAFPCLGCVADPQQHHVRDKVDTA